MQKDATDVGKQTVVTFAISNHFVDRLYKQVGCADVLNCCDLTQVSVEPANGAPLQSCVESYLVFYIV